MSSFTELDLGKINEYKTKALTAYNAHEFDIKKHSNNVVELVFKQGRNLQDKYDIFFGVLAFAGALKEGIVIPHMTLRGEQNVRLNEYGRNIFAAMEQGMLAMAEELTRTHPAQAPERS